MTAIELLVTLAVAAILAALAAPSFRAQINSARLSSHANSLLASLLFARSEAIKRNGRVVVCKSADGATCATSGDWDQGWIVFADTDNDAQRSPDSEPLLQSTGPLTGGFKLRGDANVGTYVSYTGTGAPLQIGGGLQPGTFSLCQISDSPVTGRQLVINATGRPSVRTTSFPNCN